MAHRLDYADLYFQYSRAESWSLEEGIVKSGSFNIDQGVGVRAVSGEKTAFAYSDDISLAALDERGAGHARDRAAGRQRSRVAGRHGAARGRDALSAARSARQRSTDADKVALLERLERYARALDPRVTQVMAGLAGEYEVVLVARSDGLMAADVRPLVRLSVHGDRRAERPARAGLAPAAAGASTTPISTDALLQRVCRAGGASGADQSRCARRRRRAP